MRVVQLIDTLNPGGAERVAVDYANGLNQKIETSYLCATRQEGLLKAQISPEVGYLFLNRKRTLDIKAASRLIQFCKKERIDILHAHASSFFIAYLVKWRLPKIKIVWHDHYGNSEDLESRPIAALHLASRKFDLILSVNEKLKRWAAERLKTKNIQYLANAVTIKPQDSHSQLQLSGDGRFRIICLANFRAQKDHFTLLKAFEKVNDKIALASLHLIGKNWEDNYYKEVMQLLSNLKCRPNVYLYGQQQEVAAILSQATIGVLSSKSEGLPMALLEYGASNLAPVTTAVGQCAQVLENDRYCVAPQDHDQLAERLLKLLEEQEEREQWKQQFNKQIIEKYSLQARLEDLVLLYKKC